MYCASTSHRMRLALVCVKHGVLEVCHLKSLDEVEI